MTVPAHGGRVVHAAGTRIQQLHDHFVIFDAVDDDLPRQPTPLAKPELTVEGLGRFVRAAHLDDELRYPASRANASVALHS